MILNEETTVYVACPSGTATGGPELLHQLVHSLRLLGVNAYMYYLPVIDNPVHNEYKCYSNPYVRSIKDDPKSVQ